MILTRVFFFTDFSLESIRLLRAGKRWLYPMGMFRHYHMKT